MSERSDSERRQRHRLDELERAVAALIQALDSGTRNPVADAAINRAKEHLHAARRLADEPRPPRG